MHPDADLLHALLIALGAEHVVDGEAGTHITQKLNIIQVQQPVGDDQWSNMLGGTELISRKLGKDAYAMTITLLTDSQGKKMGKTAGMRSGSTPTRPVLLSSTSTGAMSAMLT